METNAKRKESKLAWPTPPSSITLLRTPSMYLQSKWKVRPLTRRIRRPSCPHRLLSRIWRGEQSASELSTSHVSTTEKVQFLFLALMFHNYYHYCQQWNLPLSSKWEWSWLNTLWTDRALRQLLEAGRDFAILPPDQIQCHLDICLSSSWIRRSQDLCYNHFASSASLWPHSQPRGKDKQPRRGNRWRGNKQIPSSHRLPVAIRSSGCRQWFYIWETREQR